MQHIGIRAAIARHPFLAVILVASALAVAFGMSRSASATTASCPNAATLAGSAFEIDVNANLVVNTSGCIDWLADGTGSGLRSGVLSKNDVASGTGDDAFGQGTKENDANPTIVAGSIPPNKSDLKVFGVFTETSATAKFLELFWARVNSPQGTTNMDFELNQKFCDPTATPTNCANNGVPTPETPLRTTGDKLITYDLSNGGTVPTISIRTWDGTVWGAPTVISGGSSPQALGSVNTSTIAAADADGVGTNTAGGLDPFTFGEASINFNALFPPGSACGSFGSAYLKSRSSDQFNAEIKDFIAPERVNISNCTGLTTNASGPVTIGSSISDTATLSGATAGAGGTITFRAFSDASCSTQVFTSTVTVNGPGDYNSGNFTPTAVGTYFWTASYTGDINNAPSATACGDANESSVVNKTNPMIATTLSASTITVGDSAHDSATLTGATADAGGTVTYTVYTDNACTQGARDAGTKTVTNGVVPDSNSLQFNTAGTFYWQAVYSGDANNNGAMSDCTTEQLVVNKTNPSIATTLSASTITVGDSAHDSATLTGATADAGGTVTYTVYTDNACTAGARDAGTKTVTNGVVPDSNSLQFDTPGTFYWQAVYSGDANNNGATSDCTTEQLVVVKAQSNIATAQQLFPQDAATISASAGGTPTGSVTFELFAPGDTTCSGSAVYSETVALGGGSASTSNGTFSVTAGTSGTYRWQVTYPGDATHNGTTSACGTEQFTATITNS